MSTVENAVRLLGFFDDARPEIGLSEFRSLAGRDKATVFRYLRALEAAGLVEQVATTRRYRIGAGVLRLAQLREAAVPRRAAMLDVLPRLADSTGETAHCAVLEGVRLVSLGVRASTRHSTRVMIDDAELPLHATASGIVVLAFAGDGLRPPDTLARYTQHTATDAEAVARHVSDARRTGFGTSDQGFEEEVYGIAAPLFDAHGDVAGSVAVASIRSRMSPALHATIRAELTSAARGISRGWGGRIPDSLEDAWAAHPAAA